MPKPEKKLELVIATKNKKKLREIKDLLRGFNFRVTSLEDYPGAPRIIENGKTFNENAVKKALKIARFSGKLTLGEDSGLEVAILGNKPGVYSSRFAGKNKSDNQNNQKLLQSLAGVSFSKRKARYRCSVAIAGKNGVIAVVEGSCSGVIAFSPKGRHGFGYDPLFYIPKYKKTFAELGLAVKHRMSHRFHALKKARKVLLDYYRGEVE